MKDLFVKNVNALKFTVYKLKGSGNVRIVIFELPLEAEQCWNIQI